MKIKILLLVVLTAILIVSGCTSQNHSPLTVDEKKAIDFIERQDYSIASHLDQPTHYILDKEMIKEIPHNTVWGVQSVTPDLYFNKEITVYSYIVEDHPLEEVVRLMKGDYAIQLNVFICDEEVIGGTSSIISQDGHILCGADYSLDGKTLEEMTGLTYKQWLESWTAKYSK